jgi:transposase-like protein
MRAVMDGCKVCGKRMLTDGSPLIHRTCNACKAEQRRKSHRKTAARRKAKRHAAKAKLPVPRCEQCDKAIKDANRLADLRRWARKFCSNACRQAAFRGRHGQA